MSWRAIVGAAALVGLAACVQAPPVPARAEPTPAELAARRQAEAAAIEQAALEARVAQAVQRADEAFVYGYPLLVGEMLRLQMTGVAKAAGQRAPANSFWHARRLPAAGEPRHPLVDDADTLASFAWLDLGREAMLVTWPSMGRRWFSVSLHSQWMQALHTAGSSLGDGKAARVLVAGPEWQGSVPPGATLVRSPTRHALLALRIQTSGSDADLRALQALQAQLRIVPQTVRTRRAPAEAAAAPALPVAPGTPQQQVAALDTATAFELLAHLLGRAAPPAGADEPLLQRIAAIGIEPGRPFRMDALEPAVQAALADTAARMQRRLAGLRPQVFAQAGSWQAAPAGGDFGTDYARRAAVAALQWPGTDPRQLLELSTRTDAEGRLLDGAHDYLLAFARGEPPVNGFWSLTLTAGEDGRGGFIADSAGRLNLGTRDKLAAGAGAALELFVQYLSPGLDNAARWLPAPKGGFMLTLRLYAPKTTPPSALPPGQGSWLPPELRRAP
jgi:hypothetical protein